MATSGTMTGGSEADLFIPTEGAGFVTITNFQNGTDKILSPDYSYVTEQVGSDTRLSFHGDVVALLKKLR